MVIREVTAKQEASEAKLVEERTADLKKVIAIFLARLTWLIHTSVLPSNWNLGKNFALTC